MGVIARPQPRSACYAPLWSRRSHRNKVKQPPSPPKRDLPCDYGNISPQRSKVHASANCAWGAYVFDRAFASMHAAGIPAPRTLTWNPRVDPRLHTMMTYHIWSLDIFFEGRTVVRGPHRLDRPSRLQMNIDAIILNIVKGERTYHKSLP